MHVSAHIISHPLRLYIYVRVHVYVHIYVGAWSHDGGKALRHKRVLSSQNVPLGRVGLCRRKAGVEGKPKTRLIVVVGVGVGIGLSDGGEVSGAPVLGYL